MMEDDAKIENELRIINETIKEKNVKRSLCIAYAPE